MKTADEILADKHGYQVFNADDQICREAFIHGLQIMRIELADQLKLAGERAEALRGALENIAKPTYGTEICNTDAENDAILARHFFSKQRYASEALEADDARLAKSK